ncbi:MAG: hypothetical protein LBJ24_00045 [Treponema sp.]|nr:hypothetical protein [Treponema sp.]
MAFCKLYDRKNALAATGMLNDVVRPFFDSHELRCCVLLTDRGSEYCGSRERSD